MDELVQKTIRTYKGDVEAAVQEQKTTVAQVVAAQENARRNEGDRVIAPTTTEGSTAKKLLVAIICLILIGAGIAGGYYLYLQSPLANLKTQKIEVAATFPSLITGIEQKKLVVKSVADIGSKMASELEITGASLTELVLVTEDAQKIETKLPAQTVFRAIAARAPSPLARSLTDEYMIGIYRGNKTAPFVIFKNNYFQNALSGMFVWETKIPEDMQVLFSNKNDDGTLVFFDPENKFTDALVNNHDIRKLVDGEGRERFLYTFSDNETIVLTTTQEALGHLLTTLDKQAFIRKK